MTSSALAAASEHALAAVPASKAVPLARRCKRATTELRAQLALCRQAVLSSGDAAERAVLGRRHQPRLNGAAAEEALASSGGAATSSACASRASVKTAAVDDQMDPATVWHPPGNEDQAMWKELALLVEGLGEENPKWANCLARVVQRLEASHTACRKQRDALLQGEDFSEPKRKTAERQSEATAQSPCDVPSLAIANSSAPAGAAGEARALDVEAVQPGCQTHPAELSKERIIFAGYGRVAPATAAVTATSAAASAAENLSVQTRSGRADETGSSAAASHVIATKAAVVTPSKAAPGLATSLGQSPQREVVKPPPLCFGPAKQFPPLSSSATAPANGSAHRAAQPPTVPSVQISLLGDRGEAQTLAAGARIAVAGRGALAPSDTASSSEDSCDEGHNLLNGSRGVWSTSRAPGTVPAAQVDAATPVSERPAPVRSPRRSLESAKTPPKMLGSQVGHAQNGFEAATPTANKTATQSSSASLAGAAMTSASGVVWPTLYTPRSTVGMHAGARAEDAGDRRDGYMDGLSRSATSLPSHTYTPRQTPSSRIGTAPVRNHAASRNQSGSSRYPPSGMSRPLGVQRMASGTLTQPSGTPPSQVAPSPRHLNTVSNGTAPTRVSVRAPSASASPLRAMQQWPGAHRTSAISSVVAPAAVNHSSSANVSRVGHGVSRQSSAERLASAAPGGHSTALPGDSLPTTYLSTGTLSLAIDAARRSIASATGSGSVAGSASGPVGGGSGSSAPRGQSTPAAVPKLPTNGLVSFNSKGAPPPQTSMPVSSKGYSSIQLWTPRRQPGNDGKQAAVSREPREVSIEPAQVARSPSVGPLSISPRYASMGLHAPSAISPSSTLMSKLATWRT